MNFTAKQEQDARVAAIASDHDPDEVVSTNGVDHEGVHLEMPIWQAIASADAGRVPPRPEA